MSESAKSQRTVEEIQREYQNLCLKAGDLQYKIECQEKDLTLVNQEIRQLNFEYISAQQLAAKVAEQVAAEKAKDKAAAEATAPAPDNVTSINKEEKPNG